MSAQLPRFVPGIDAPQEPSGPAWWFIFRKERLLVREEGPQAGIPQFEEPGALPLAVAEPHYLGRLDGRDCYAAEMEGEEPPEGFALHGLRGLYERLDEGLFSVAGRAVQILGWDRTHRFCGQCGTATLPVPGERAKRCPACGLTSYPRLSPAVITLVSRGPELLLVRGHSFPEGFYGLLAGFVEPGESLEEAVAREIHEEVGIAIRDLRYFGSQPWPYPHQIMVGFTATWEAGEIRVEPQELADAAWFTRETLPRIPPRLSIARRIIDAFLDGRVT